MRFFFLFCRIHNNTKKLPSIKKTPLIWKAQLEPTCVDYSCLLIYASRCGTFNDLVLIEWSCFNRMISRFKRIKKKKSFFLKAHIKRSDMVIAPRYEIWNVWEETSVVLKQLHNNDLFCVLTVMHNKDKGSKNNR